MSELKTADQTQLKKELQLTPAEDIHAVMGGEGELDSHADKYVEQLLNATPEDLNAREKSKASVETMGADLQKKSAQQMSLLQQPISKLSQRGAEGGEVANALVDLKMKVEELDPGKFDFEEGWLSRSLGRLPGVGTPLKRYFTKFESAQTVIAAVVRSLEQGRDQLSRDNITLSEDQKQMRAMTFKLEKAIKLGQLIDQKLQYKLERELQQDAERSKFVSEELVFPLRQRIMDLQQQLAVNQQGVLATEIIIRNNKELMRGVDRALNVTVSALRVAATVAMALANQKIVLDKIESVNKTTSDLISGTSARLKTQGVEIQKQASSTQLDMNALKSAFADIDTAMRDVSEFRRNSLPQMAQSVLELDQITASASQSIAQMEKGNRARPDVKIEIE